MDNEQRKNYLEEELSGQEKKYLERIAVTTLNTHIKHSKRNIDFNAIPIEEAERVPIDSDDPADIVSKHLDDGIDSPEGLSKVFTSKKRSENYKALSSKEKNVLFSLYKKRNHK